MSKRGRSNDRSKTLLEKVLDYMPSWLRWGSTESDQPDDGANSQDLPPDLLSDDIPSPPAKRRALSKTVPNITSYHSKIPDIQPSTSSHIEDHNQDHNPLTRSEHFNVDTISQRPNEAVLNFTEKGDSYDRLRTTDTNEINSRSPSFSINSFKSSKLHNARISNDSTIPVWRTKDRLLRSSFYDGNTRYGGIASNDNIKVIKRESNDNLSELRTPKRFKTVSVSVRDRVQVHEASSPVISEAAKQILSTLDGISDTAKEMNKPSYLMNSPLAFQIDKSRSLLSRERMSSSAARKSNRVVLPVTSPPPTKPMIISQDTPTKTERFSDKSSALTTRLANYNSSGDSAELAEKVWRDHHRKQDEVDSVDASTPLSSSNMRNRDDASNSESYQKSSSRKMKSSRLSTRVPRKSTNTDRNEAEIETPEYELPKVALPIGNSSFPQFNFSSAVKDEKPMSVTNKKVNSIL
ncbi:hypothetical protein TrispH2_006481 [Trichoplax sp. H2]|nr:hypothetical protein TrispH2_006481 [Trichoplax sp. H2]|eukprot:RDD41339.1 hypothetical protein TrispH2_006481 [Trichoplax sp. H2]